MTIKQVIVVRTDLQMGKGKLAGQVAHASHLLTTIAYESPDTSATWLWYTEWMKTLYRKVVLKSDSEAEILRIFEEAKKAELPTIVIRDAGLTQLDPETITCVGIGPCPAEFVDALTGNLKLL